MNDIEKATKEIFPNCIIIEKEIEYEEKQESSVEHISTTPSFSLFLRYINRTIKKKKSGYFAWWRDEWKVFLFFHVLCYTLIGFVSPFSIQLILWYFINEFTARTITTFLFFSGIVVWLGFMMVVALHLVIVGLINHIKEKITSERNLEATSG